MATAGNGDGGEMNLPASSEKRQRRSIFRSLSWKRSKRSKMEENVDEPMEESIVVKHYVRSADQSGMSDDDIEDGAELDKTAGSSKKRKRFGVWRNVKKMFRRKSSKGSKSFTEGDAQSPRSPPIRSLSDPNLISSSERQELAPLEQVQEVSSGPDDAFTTPTPKKAMSHGNLISELQGKNSPIQHEVTVTVTPKPQDIDWEASPSSHSSKFVPGLSAAHDKIRVAPRDRRAPSRRGVGAKPKADKSVKKPPRSGSAGARDTKDGARNIGSLKEIQNEVEEEVEIKSNEEKGVGTIEINEMKGQVDLSVAGAVSKNGDVDMDQEVAEKRVSGAGKISENITTPETSEHERMETKEVRRSASSSSQEKDIRGGLSTTKDLHNEMREKQERRMSAEIHDSVRVDDQLPNSSVEIVDGAVDEARMEVPRVDVIPAVLSPATQKEKDEEQQTSKEISKESKPRPSSGLKIELDVAEKPRESDLVKDAKDVPLPSSPESMTSPSPQISASTSAFTIPPEVKPPLVKPAEVKPEVKPAEVKPAEVKPAEVKPAEVKPAEVKSEVKAAEVKPAEVKPAEVKPAAVKPAEVKPEVKPAEVKPAAVKPAAVKPAEVKPEVKLAEVKPEVKRAEVKPAEVKPAVVKSAEVKPPEVKPVEVKLAKVKPEVKPNVKHEVTLVETEALKDTEIMKPTIMPEVRSKPVRAERPVIRRFSSEKKEKNVEEKLSSSKVVQPATATNGSSMTSQDKVPTQKLLNSDITIKENGEDKVQVENTGSPMFSGQIERLSKNISQDDSSLGVSRLKQTFERQHRAHTISLGDRVRKPDVKPKPRFERNIPDDKSKSLGRNHRFPVTKEKKPVESSAEKVEQLASPKKNDTTTKPKPPPMKPSLKAKPKPLPKPKKDPKTSQDDSKENKEEADKSVNKLNQENKESSSEETPEVALPSFWAKRSMFSPSVVMDDNPSGPPDSSEKTKEISKPVISLKTDSCVVCGAKVYQMEKFRVKDNIVHRSCIKCSVCKRLLSVGNFIMSKNKIYCKPHEPSIAISLNM